MIHPVFSSSLLSFDPLSVCLSHISHFDFVSILVTSHTIPPSPHAQPLHLSGSVSAHLHVTTCIEFWFSTGRASRVVSLRLFPLLATYINIYLISLLVLRVCAVFSYLFHGSVLCWRFLASRSWQINLSVLGVVSNIILICFLFTALFSLL